MKRYVLLAFGLVLSLGAEAHTAGTQSYAQLQRDSTGHWLWSWRVRPADFRAQPEAGSTKALALWLADQTQMRGADDNCLKTQLQPATLRDGWLHGLWEVACEPQHIQLHWLRTLPGHLHMLQAAGELHLLRGGADHSLALQPRLVQPSTNFSAFLPQWQQGLHHIVLGWDHLAFLLGLLLWASRLRALVGLVTGFTIGHSVALLLTVLAQIQPPAVSIELIIAASIIFVALPQRGLAQRRLSSLVILGCSLLAAWLSAQSQMLWAGVALLALGHLWQIKGNDTQALLAGLILAALFGLLHGFGFAGAVLEATQQATQIWPIILGFNLGVETGQLFIVIPAWWLLQRWRHGAPMLPAAQALSCGLGAYWFCQRLLAL